MTGSRPLLYAVGFLAELLAWAGCGATAFLLPQVRFRWELAGLIVGIIVVAWGVLMAPKATLPLPTSAYYVVKGLLYLWAAVVWAVLAWSVAVAFVVLVAVSEPALYRRRIAQDEARADGPAA